MKKRNTGRHIGIALLVSLLILCLGIFAPEWTGGAALARAADDDIAGGTYDGVDWRITADGELIIGNGGEQTFTTARVYRDSGSFPWYAYRTQIKTARFDGTVHGNGHMGYMFYNCPNLTSIDLNGFDTSNVTSMYGMFWYCSELKTLDLSSFNTSKVEDMGCMFYRCNNLTELDVSSFDTSNVTNMSDMFHACEHLTTLDVSNFNTSKVTNMFSVFCNCKELTSLNISGFDTSNVTTMQQMFSECRSLESLDVSGLDTSKVTNMNAMFQNCAKLTSLDVSNFDTSNVTDMSWMFNICSALKSIDVSGFNTSKVTTMQRMFSNCYGLTSLDVSTFDTSNVTDMGHVFYNCYRLRTLDISSFDKSKVTNMQDMFSYCNALTCVNLGEKFSFKGKNITYSSYQALLPTPSSSAYTGSWIREDETHGPYTATNLRTRYTGGDMSGWWILEIKNDSGIVQFDANGGYTSDTYPRTVYANASYSQSITMPGKSTVKPGYLLTGWNTKADGTGRSFGTDETVNDAKDVAVMGKTVTIYARWETTNLLY